MKKLLIREVRGPDGHSIRLDYISKSGAVVALPEWPDPDEEMVSLFRHIAYCVNMMAPLSPEQKMEVYKLADKLKGEK